VAALGPDVEEPLQSLLLPGILITGGAVSYDRKVSQRFAGIGFASVNGQNEIYSDKVTVVLRAVSVQTGEVLESVYVSKEVLSQMNSINVLKIVNNSTLAIEAGMVSNEPVSVAVRTAISAAVRELFIRGLARGWWEVA
jgi:curli production assembly/transport component CsgG